MGNAHANMAHDRESLEQMKALLKRRIDERIRQVVTLEEELAAVDKKLESMTGVK